MLCTVQSLAGPRVAWRRTVKKKKVVNSWASVAYALAAEAYEENFSSRRGGGEMSDRAGRTVGFYIYDNNPWAGDPTARARDYADLTIALAERGCRLAAHASYPERADAGDAGYTIAMVYISESPERASEDHEFARARISELVRRRIEVAA